METNTYLHNAETNAMLSTFMYVLHKYIEYTHSLT